MVLKAEYVGSDVSALSHLIVLFMTALVDGIRSSPFIFSGYGSLGENCFWNYNFQKLASKYAEFSITESSCFVFVSTIHDFMPSKGFFFKK